MQDHVQHADGAAHGGHGGHGGHDHEPLIMIAPLLLLAVGAVLAGFLNFPAPGLGNFLGHSPSFVAGFHAANADAAQAARPHGGQPTHGEYYVDPVPFGQHGEHHIHWGVMAVSTLVAGAGIGVAYLMHLRDRRLADRLAEKYAGPVRAIDAKYWIDEMYQAGVVEPLRGLGRAFFAMDRYVVDGLVWLIGFLPAVPGYGLKLTVQRGYLQGYAAAMLFGVAAILLIIFL